MRNHTLCPLVCLLGLTLCITARADVIRLRTGGQLRGTSTRQGEIVRIESELGTVIELDASLVHFVTRQTEEEAQFDRRYAAVPRTAPALWALAQWCRANRLRTERTWVLQEVLQQDADHADARRALGYILDDSGTWTKREQTMSRRGYVRHRARFVTRQERDSIATTRADRTAEAHWTRQLGVLSQALRRGDNRGLTEIREIRDPLAVAALAAWLRDLPDSEVRLAYVRTLARIRHKVVLPPLIEQGVADSDPEIRREVAQIIPPESRSDAVRLASEYLQAADNETVRRAAELLGRMGDPDAVPALIDALITLHDYGVRPSADPEVRQRAVDLMNVEALTPEQVVTVMQAGVTPRGGALVTSPEANGRLLALYAHRNPAVLQALRRITGEDFGFDRWTWRLWVKSVPPAAASP